MEKDPGLDETEIVIEFHPFDRSASESLRSAFSGEEILESSGFTGSEIVAVVVSLAKGALGKVLDFFAANRANYRDAVVKIGIREISLKGYSSEEIRQLLESGLISQALADIKKK